MSARLHLVSALRDLVRHGTLSAGLLACALSWLVFEWMAADLHSPPKKNTGLLVGGWMTVLVVPLWRLFAARRGGFQAAGGCLAAVFAWAGTFVFVWVLIVTIAAIRPNRMLPSATVGERVLDAVFGGLIISGFLSLATLPATFALLVLALWIGRRGSGEFETGASGG